MLRVTTLALGLTLLAAPAQGADRKPPYWASISAGEARMRTGPGKAYPATWLYKKRDLPIRVVGTYPNWRKVQEPDGTTGWMLVSLLSDTRTAIIPPGPARALHAAPAANAKVAYRVGPGVVGRVSKCGGGWCRFDVGGGRSGFVRTSDVWGVDPREEID